MIFNGITFRVSCRQIDEHEETARNIRGVRCIAMHRTSCTRDVSFSSSVKQFPPLSALERPREGDSPAKDLHHNASILVSDNCFGGCGRVTNSDEEADALLPSLTGTQTGTHSDRQTDGRKVKRADPITIKQSLRYDASTAGTQSRR